MEAVTCGFNSQSVVPFSGDSGTAPPLVPPSPRLIRFPELFNRGRGEPRKAPHRPPRDRPRILPGWDYLKQKFLSETQVPNRIEAMAGVRWPKEFSAEGRNSGDP